MRTFRELIDQHMQLNDSRGKSQSRIKSGSKECGKGSQKSLIVCLRYLLGPPCINCIHGQTRPEEKLSVSGETVKGATGRFKAGATSVADQAKPKAE